MQLHRVFAVGHLDGKLAHAVMLAAVECGRLGVFNLQVGMIHRVAIRKALLGQPGVSVRVL